MSERKKKVDMHILIASKMLNEIRARGIDKLQDIEDDILTQRQMSNANRADFMTFMKKATETPRDFMDKMRLLLIFIHCS
jgi:hypothetical protein